MKKTNLKDLFYHLQNQMIAKLSTSRSSIAHPGTKGDATELNWLQWLKDYLPKRYCVDKAFVIDCNDNISDQIDIVIYDQQYSPFVFNQDAVIFIPAESVYAIFEVKQDLSKEHIEYAGQKAESVRTLARTSIPIPHAGGYYPPKPHNKILAGILTLSSTWSDPLGDTFETHINALSENQQVDIGCALESGSFLVNYQSNPVSILKSTAEESFIFLFLNLLIELQKMATIPAMDIRAYAKVLDSNLSL
nr:DUF6602 domain-containing protein [uncultured Anaeromusa sp.]